MGKTLFKKVDYSLSKLIYNFVCIRRSIDPVGCAGSVFKNEGI